MLWWCRLWSTMWRKHWFNQFVLEENIIQFFVVMHTCYHGIWYLMSLLASNIVDAFWFVSIMFSCADEGLDLCGILRNSDTLPSCFKYRKEKKECIWSWSQCVCFMHVICNIFYYSKNLKPTKHSCILLLEWIVKIKNLERKKQNMNIHIHLSKFASHINCLCVYILFFFGPIHYYRLYII